MKKSLCRSIQLGVIRLALTAALLLIAGCATAPEIPNLLGKWQCGGRWAIYVYRDEIASINGLKGKWTKIGSDEIRLEYRESERSPERILRLMIVENKIGMDGLEILKSLGEGRSPLQQPGEACNNSPSRGKEVTCLEVNGQALVCDR